MNKNPDPVHRLAIVEAHKWICVICQKPITGEFEIDHMIPQDMAREDRKAEFDALCERLERPDFDIWGLGNLGPAHPKCNKNKDNDILPDAALHERLKFIGGKIEEIERRVLNIRKNRDFEAALLVVLDAISTGEISETDVNVRLSSRFRVNPPDTHRYAVGWAPAALETLKAQHVSLDKIKDAIVSAVLRGEMKVLRNAAHPGSWTFRFNIATAPWRAVATLDDGLLLLTKIFPRSHGY